MVIWRVTEFSTWAMRFAHPGTAFGRKASIASPPTARLRRKGTAFGRKASIASPPTARLRRKGTAFGRKASIASLARFRRAAWLVAVRRGFVGEKAWIRIR
ncbi:hypothetical protein OOZ19_22240 [Saccharopolyspora sp. NFXS83]|uniref:hypothetical protein n=1 Tax=Saccharopolyspora sp. NFXS83 TaxID=2993560 RepID=UPI00224B57E1|nr:hypothetical protein [Saccharopolyspora sp. NFXS83]MCX2732968.1 hypothetical protein [Saccharopolyspora sp. NFXS83]